MDRLHHAPQTWFSEVLYVLSSSVSKPPRLQPRHLNLELLERRLLLSGDTDFTGGVLTITCGAEDDSISVRIDAGGGLILNEVNIRVRKRRKQ